MVWGLPLTRLSRASYRTLMWRTKRAFDLVLASLALVLLSPVMLVCALAVRLEGGPGVIFRQERVGLDGRRFQILKFRSIRLAPGEASGLVEHRQGPAGGPGRADDAQAVARRAPAAVEHHPGRHEPGRSAAGAARRSWRSSRRSSRGTSPGTGFPSGSTGWAQVHGLRGDTDIADRASFDNYYIENWSMWSDIKIMLRTVGQVLGGRGR